MKKLVIIVALLAIVAGTLPIAASAQGGAATQYKPLVELPAAAPKSGTTFVPYLLGMFKLFIWLTAFFATIMVIYGGFQYLSTDSFSGKSEGKATITRAIEGLLLAIVSWLILYTVNPKLVEFNLDLGYTAPAQPGGVGGQVAGTVTGATGNTVDASVARAVLASEGITPNRTCVTQAGCATSLIGIRDTTVGGVIELKAACGAACSNLVMTGATEAGFHSEGGTYTHVNGYKMDISNTAQNGAAFQQYLYQEIQRQNPGVTPQVDQNYNITLNGYQYVIRPESNHIDITVKSGPSTSST